MTIKDQFEVLKKNWLVVALILVLVVFLSDGNIVGKFRGGFDDGVAMRDSLQVGGGYVPVSSGESFAPEVEDRKVTKTASLSAEIERGEFGSAEEVLRNVVSGSDVYLLNERVSRQGEGWSGYYYGYYSIKVETSRYDVVVAELKKIGEVQSFSENAEDVTGRFEDLNIELEAEKARLGRYEEMYDDAVEFSDKVELNDRIFTEERRIGYLEDLIENVENRVDYSTISFSMTEEKSKWADIAIVGVGDLIRAGVGSLNKLLGFLFSVLPWVVVGWIGWIIWKRVKGQT